MTRWLTRPAVSWRGAAGWDSGPTPPADAVEAQAAKYAEAWPVWGHRKIAALMRADGHQVSTSAVERALRCCGLLLAGYRADRTFFAAIRRRVFRDPSSERCLRSLTVPVEQSLQHLGRPARRDPPQAELTAASVTPNSASREGSAGALAGADVERRPR